MPKTAKKKEAIDPELPFEEALSKLEALVQGMESDQIPLDGLIKNYEEGTALYQICAQRLDEARGRIEKIRLKRGGDVSLEPIPNAAGDAPNPQQSQNVTSNTDSEA